jgi:hypothetical protein
MSKRTWALLAATMVSIIYGLSFTIAKDVMPTYVKPFGFILLRVFGARFLLFLALLGLCAFFFGGLLPVWGMSYPIGLWVFMLCPFP